MMSSHLAFSHLKKYHNVELVYDPSDPVIDESMWEAKDWVSSEFGHLEGKEPEPRGLGFVVRAKVDADHTSDSVT